MMQQFNFEEMIDHTLCITGYEGDETDIIIPDDCGGVPYTMLSDGIFKGHPEITSVKIPDAVHFLGGFVFDGCVNLKALTLPSGLSDVFQYTFARCGIEEIVLPAHLATIPAFAFKDCRNLRRVICHPGLKRIHAWAFQGCDSLTEVQHGPETEISPEAFAGSALQGGNK